MAQTMLLTANAKVDLRSKESLVERLKPKPLSSFFLPSLPLKYPSASASASSHFTSTTVALFKSKAKAPAKKVVPKPKEKVEDGIFGTSGGIGFTKQNELFVGRVAMIGFAASLLGEAITGKGILAQLNLETGIPIYEAEPLLLFFILFNLLGAIGALEDRGKFIDDPAPPTGLDKAVIPPGKGFKSALGLSEGGPLFEFTKANELFVGRLAQLGIAFSIIGEIITGKGALAQLNFETGVPINEIEPLLLFNIVFFFVAAINPGTGKFVTDEEEE
ncbi:photosystem II 22 kDa protein, chloroplastic [Nicotiana tabacum]|uniref:Photosystem II 22 kDa protein, chloroplastic n=1 Tax=Nicotiana tabacum TaxID=4097 RepID=PSBS_TOBAC|nr:photosystem II 22 kDa protein, chloroplastic [Nicotiana tabacum]Q9SMB4.1 RecName: Full=Photosystem II 22 kDa protein, chloroplastic; AltName: Full=CP22; Flags: Precursor [Nicotiana tabacum]CAA59007.1 precursor of photosystem II subunit (22KDa) [Nicotiana tabacum]